MLADNLLSPIKLPSLLNVGDGEGGKDKRGKGQRERAWDRDICPKFHTDDVVLQRLLSCCLMVDMLILDFCVQATTNHSVDKFAIEIKNS